MKPDNLRHVVGKRWTPVCEVEQRDVLLTDDESAAAVVSPPIRSRRRGLLSDDRNIEDIVAGDYIVSRDQNDPHGPLVYSRVDRVYKRLADHLRVLRIRDFPESEQTLKTTDEHPYHAQGKGWIKARDLEVGDVFFGLDGSCGVLLASTREEHPEGVWVYNLRIEGTHTYFVRQQGVDAEPVWVHNAEYQDGMTGTGDLAGQGNDKFRGAILADVGNSPLHESLPNYGGIRGRATSGTLVSESGDAYLRSGAGPGENFSQLDQYVIQDHVEVHAAQLMQQNTIAETTLYINHPNGPCSGGFGCYDFLPDLLPDGALLHVVSPAGRITFYGGYI